MVKVNLSHLSQATVAIVSSRSLLGSEGCPFSLLAMDDRLCLVRLVVSLATTLESVLRDGENAILARQSSSGLKPPVVKEETLMPRPTRAPRLSVDAVAAVPSCRSALRIGEHPADVRCSPTRASLPQHLLAKTENEWCVAGKHKRKKTWTKWQWAEWWADANARRWEEQRKEAARLALRSSAAVRLQAHFRGSVARKSAAERRRTAESPVAAPIVDGPPAICLPSLDKKKAKKKKKTSANTDDDKLLDQAVADAANEAHVHFASLEREFRGKVCPSNHAIALQRCREPSNCRCCGIAQNDGCMLACSEAKPPGDCPLFLCIACGKKGERSGVLDAAEYGHQNG